MTIRREAGQPPGSPPPRGDDGNAIAMKVAVTASEPSLAAGVDPRSARCPCFLVVDTDDTSFEVVENPNAALGGGAGVQSAQLMVEKGVQAVLTGNCGPNAYQALSAAGIGVLVGCSGPVSDVLEQFRAGRLHAVGRPNVVGKFGLGRASALPQRPWYGSRQPARTGSGTGPGPGGGRGMGRGRGGGRGMGRGRGRGMGAAYRAAAVPAPQRPARAPAGHEELAMLKRQAEAVSRQMQQIQERVRQLKRAGQGGMTAAVRPGQCTGCSLCVQVCPVGAIRLDDSGAVVDAQACTGCGACVAACPNQAISMASSKGT